MLLHLCNTRSSRTDVAKASAVSSRMRPAGLRADQGNYCQEEHLWEYVEARHLMYVGSHKLLTKGAQVNNLSLGRGLR